MARRSRSPLSSQPGSENPEGNAASEPNESSTSRQAVQAKYETDGGTVLSIDKSHLRRAADAVMSHSFLGRLGPANIGIRFAISRLARSLKTTGSGQNSVPASIQGQGQAEEQAPGQAEEQAPEQGHDPAQSDAGHEPETRQAAVGEPRHTHPAYVGSPSISERELIEFWALVGRWMDEGEKAQVESPSVSQGSGLRVDRAESLEERPLVESVKQIVAAMTKVAIDELDIGDDGDIGIKAGSAMVYVRTRDAPPLVDVFSPVLMDVEPSADLYVRLSELTNRMPIGRLYFIKGTVWGSVPVFGRNLQPTHLMLAVQVMIGLADELDDRLKREFGGRRFFE